MGNLSYYFCRELFLLPLRPWTRFQATGMEHVPATGPGLILANHISHFDPPYLAAKCPRVIHFMADKPLLEIPVMGKMMKWGHVFPIDRNKADRGALKTALARLESGNVVCIFPERGIRHGKTSVLQGAELPVGTASLWRMADVPVIPMIIIGTDQIYAWKRLCFDRPRIFVRAGRPLAPDKNASREELRDRIVAAWMELFDGIKRDYGLRPGELPQSAQARWGVPEPDSQPAETGD
jgi:1-acyl-sn-glycerol-3-phosphate acyltransferase